MLAHFKSNSKPPVRSVDPTLYLVINPEQCRFDTPAHLAVKAAAGGVSAVQVRCKSLDDKDYAMVVQQIADALHPRRIPVFVNDRVDVAFAAQIHCIHLGQTDDSVHLARDRLGDRAQIGLTVRSMEEAENAPLEELSYVSVGGVFPTRSKYNPNSPIGLGQLRDIVDSLKSRDPECPIIAISGINLSNVNAVLAAGADGVAVVSAICESNDPESAARQLRNKITNHHAPGL